MNSNRETYRKKDSSICDKSALENGISKNFAFPNPTTALGYKDEFDKGLTLPIGLIRTYS